MKRIDFEYHFYIPEALEVMARAKEKGIYPWYDPVEKRMHWSEHISEPQAKLLPGLLCDFDDRVAYMDECGIDAAVLSSAPGVDELGSDSIPLCRSINDNIYEHMKRYPGRFYGSAILPMHDVDAACTELKRCVNELGFVAWHTHSVFLNQGLDEDKFIPLFKLAADLGIYVYVHPRCSFNKRMLGFDFNLPGSGFGFTVDTQITIVRMMLKGIFDQIPDLKVMLGHLAEGFPFYLERMQSRLNLHPVEAIKMEKSVKYYFEHNILASTSGNMSKEAFLLTKNIMGIDRMFIGSDVPFESGSEMLRFLDDIPLTVEEREKLYYKNAEKLLGKHFM